VIGRMSRIGLEGLYILQKLGSADSYRGSMEFDGGNDFGSRTKEGRKKGGCKYDSETF